MSASKVWITNEVSDSYTATVSDKGQVRLNTGGAWTHANINKAASSAMAVLVNGAAYLKEVILGAMPATASCLLIVDSATSAASATTYDVSGSAKITKIQIPVAAAATGDQPRAVVIPLEVFCATGITYNVGGDGASMGNVTNITFVYQDL